MIRSHFIKLFEYTSWADQTIGKLLLENPTDNGLKRFKHMHSANIIWLSRMLNIQEDVKVWEEDYALDTLLQEFKTVNRQYIDLIQHLVDFDKKISYKNSKGEPFEQSIDAILTHVVNHATYHRGQIVTDIKPFLENIPATDFIFYDRVK